MFLAQRGPQATNDPAVVQLFSYLVRPAHQRLAIITAVLDCFVESTLAGFQLRLSVEKLTLLLSDFVFRHVFFLFVSQDYPQPPNAPLP